MNLIIFGAPGSGKGTQAKFVSSALKIAHISTGDILRDEVKKATELGLRIKEVIDRGEFVPDSMIAEIVETAVQSSYASKGYILDGFPRTIEQAVILDDMLGRLGMDKPLVISLVVPDDIIVERLSKRRVCGSCGSNVALPGESHDEACPICGTIGNFTKRKDDDEAVVRKRLEVFHSLTSPVLDFYEKRGQVIIIDGTGDVEKITRDILAGLSA